MKNFVTDAEPMLSGSDLLLFNEEFRINYPDFMERHYFDEDTADVCDICIDMQRDSEFSLSDVEKLANSNTHNKNGFKKILFHWKNIVLHYENDYVEKMAGWHEEYRNGEIDKDEYEEGFAKWRRLLNIGEQIWSRLTINQYDPPPYPMFTERREVNCHVREPSTISLAGLHVPKSYMDAYVESVNALYRMSLLAESRGDSRIAVNALNNRVSLHVKIFEYLGLDHDSTNDAENSVRDAIDEYTERNANVPIELRSFMTVDADA